MDNGANVISLPLEGGYNSDLVSAVAYANAHDALIASAAGNGALETPSLPARLSGLFDNVVSAGAQTEGARLPESNLVGNSGAIQLDAQGIGVGAMPNHEFGTVRGTSVATARLAGAATLVRAANPTLTARQTRQLLLATADLPAEDSDSFGALNTQKAVQQALTSAEVSIFTDSTYLVIGETSRSSATSWSGVPLVSRP